MPNEDPPNLKTEPAPAPVPEKPAVQRFTPEILAQLDEFDRRLGEALARNLNAQVTADRSDDKPTSDPGA